MKMLFLVTVVLLGSMAMASSNPDWAIHKKRHYATPEPGVVSMLCLSLSTVGAGFALRYRRKVDGKGRQHKAM